MNHLSFSPYLIHPEFKNSQEQNLYSQRKISSKMSASTHIHSSQSFNAISWIRKRKGLLLPKSRKLLWWQLRCQLVLLCSKLNSSLCLFLKKAWVWATTDSLDFLADGLTCTLPSCQIPCTKTSTLRVLLPYPENKQTISPSPNTK